MSDLLGSSFYAGLAGRNADQAHANLQAANAAVDRADRNARIAKEWMETSRRNKANCESWMAYAHKLEGQVKKWQADAVESEAISRAKNQILRDHTGEGFRQFVNDDEYQEIKTQKIQEVCSEWGVNPFES
jgi:hypothetical protein